MIEQTEMLVIVWQYTPPVQPLSASPKIVSSTGFDVMRKRAATKKGIACRFTCYFKIDDQPILEYVGENSYVIDLEDVIDRNELLRMIRNAYAMYQEKFDFRKLGTVLSDQTLRPLNEAVIEMDTILEMLV